MKEAIETLVTFELFKNRDPSQFSIERLGGLTNKNFKVIDGENKYVLRIPGEGTEEYIDRKAEEVAARISAEVGVNAVVLYKAICDLLWTLWGALQLANDNPAVDFKAYANERFERCHSLMSSKDFSMHLSVVEKTEA